jgi:nucleoid DNA-binding protein
MNYINAKTIKDISADIADKNNVSPKAVEELYNYFYKTVVKKKLLSFESHQYSIRYLGTFSLRVDPETLNYLTNTVETRLANYTLLAEDTTELKPWVLKSRDFYQKTKDALIIVRQNMETLSQKRLIIKQERKNYVK